MEEHYYLQALMMGIESVRTNSVYPEELKKPPELPFSSEGGAWGGGRQLKPWAGAEKEEKACCG